MSSVRNGLYFLTLPLVSVMRVIYRKIRHARYLYIKRNVEKDWGARYTLGVRYLSKYTLIFPEPNYESAAPSARAVYRACLRTLPSRDCGFESSRFVDTFVSCEYSVFARYRSLSRADPSSTGALTSVMCVRVISKSRPRSE